MFVLYQQDLLGLSVEAALQRVGEDRLAGYAAHLAMGVDREKPTIDKTLADHVVGWDLDRLGVLERAILRTAAFELLREPDVPEAVAIDEAVALAKRFCSSEAGALINGVLGSVARAKREADE